MEFIMSSGSNASSTFCCNKNILANNQLINFTSPEMFHFILPLLTLSHKSPGAE